MAFEPQRGWVILNMSRLPSVTGLIPREKLKAGNPNVPDGADISEMQGTPYGLYRARARSPLDLPCNKPPWGTLLAVDTATGEVKWEVPLGTVRDLAPVPLPIKWGTPNLGGPIVTQNGLVFIGAAMDNYLRAFDLETGKELWKRTAAGRRSGDANDLPLGENGRQFVVIAAGGMGVSGPTSAIRWWRLLCLRVAWAFWLSQWPQRSEPSAFCWSSCWQPCSSSDWRPELVLVSAAGHPDHHRDLGGLDCQPVHPYELAYCSWR